MSGSSFTRSDQYSSRPSQKAPAGMMTGGFAKRSTLISPAIKMHALPCISQTRTFLSVVKTIVLSQLCTDCKTCSESNHLHIGVQVSRCNKV